MYRSSSSTVVSDGQLIYTTFVNAKHDVQRYDVAQVAVCYQCSPTRRIAYF